MAKKSNKKDKKDNKYNAENEIIIGVTTKPKEKVRVENKKSTRTNPKKGKDLKSKKTNNKKITNKNNMKSHKQGKVKVKKVINENVAKEKEIRNLNRKRLAISICILLFIVLCGTIYYLTTPVFNIASIEVYGNNKNSVDTYISLSGINLNETNIFAFANNNIEKKIKEDPYVEVVEIKRKLPNTIQLYITERNVDYQVAYLNSYIYLNNQGYILEINEKKENVTEIDGLSSISDNIQEGQRLENEDLIKLDTILKITNYLKYNNNYEVKLTKIDVNDILNYILEFKEEKKVAYIGDSSSITEKMTAVVKILEAEEGKKGNIYADEDALKRNRIYFSEKK